MFYLLRKEVGVKDKIWILIGEGSHNGDLDRLLDREWLF